MSANNRGNREDTRETGRRHLKYAQFCEQFAVWLAAIGGRYLTAWALVLLHYSALHYIDAYLVGVCGIVSLRHMDQDRAIAADRDLQPVGAKYIYLRETSEAARYRMRGFRRTEFQDMRRLFFEPVKSQAMRLIVRSHVASRAETVIQPELLAHSMNDIRQGGERRY